MSGRFCILLAALLAAACAPGGAPLSADSIVVTRPLPGSGTSAAYLTLNNNSAEDIVITRVVSPEFASVAMHESVLKDGVSRMRPLARLVVPAHGTLGLEPGGKHLMLHGAGAASSTVTLHFYAGDTPLLTVSTVLED